jgi:hypothetical protein
VTYADARLYDAFYFQHCCGMVYVRNEASLRATGSTAMSIMMLRILRRGRCGSCARISQHIGWLTRTSAGCGNWLGRAAGRAGSRWSRACNWLSATSRLQNSQPNSPVATGASRGCAPNWQLCRVIAYGLGLSCRPRRAGSSRLPESCRVRRLRIDGSLRRWVIF